MDIEKIFSYLIVLFIIGLTILYIISPLDLLPLNPIDDTVVGLVGTLTTIYIVKEQDLLEV